MCCNELTILEIQGHVRRLGDSLQKLTSRLLGSPTANNADRVEAAAAHLHCSRAASLCQQLADNPQELGV